jgi:hypothetical protein
LYDLTIFWIFAAEEAMRRTTLTTICCVTFLAAACGKAPAPGQKGTAYGEPLSDAPKVALSEIVSRPDDYVGKRIRVDGIVTKVCQMRGCWIAISEEDGPASLRFKVTDGVIVFPQNAPGQRVAAEGTVRKIELDLKQTRTYLKHEADEEGRTFDPSSVKKPMSMVRLDGISAVLTASR